MAWMSTRVASCSPRNRLSELNAVALGRALWPKRLATDSRRTGEGPVRVRNPTTSTWSPTASAVGSRSENRIPLEPSIDSTRLHVREQFGPGLSLALARWPQDQTNEVLKRASVLERIDLWGLVRL